MRTFFQNKGESVFINGDISVTVLDIDGGDVTLAIDAPEWIEIDGNGASLLQDELAERCPVQIR